MSLLDSNRNHYLILGFFSFLGLILSAFFDFGGFYYYGSDVQIWEYVYLFQSVESTILIFTEIVLFAYMIYLIQHPILNNTDLTEKQLSMFEKANWGVLGLIIVGLIFFFIETGYADDWWFDAGFFGPLISSSINLLVLKNLHNIKGYY